MMLRQGISGWSAMYGADTRRAASPMISTPRSMARNSTRSPRNLARS
jgi:hypothetical protein